MKSARNIHRRKAFYPYAGASHKIEICIEFSASNMEGLKPDDVQLSFGPDTVQEEIETWREIYGIDERYKAKCCGGDAKDWLEQVRILNDVHGIDPAASLATIQQQTDKDLVANSNFLKKAFLEGCQKAEIFEAFAREGGST